MSNLRHISPPAALSITYLDQDQASLHLSQNRKEKQRSETRDRMPPMSPKGCTSTTRFGFLALCKKEVTNSPPPLSTTSFNAHRSVRPLKRLFLIDRYESSPGTKHRQIFRTVGTSPAAFRNVRAQNRPAFIPSPPSPHRSRLRHDPQTLPFFRLTNKRSSPFARPRNWLREPLAWFRVVQILAQYQVQRFAGLRSSLSEPGPKRPRARSVLHISPFAL